MNPIIPIFLITFFCCFLVLAQDKEPIIGIHFGEAFLSVAVHKGGNVIRIKNENGHLFTPSVVSFMENGDVIIGEEANKITNSQNTIYNIRSLLGKKKKELDSNLKSTLSFKLETDSDDYPVIQLRFNNGTLLHIPPKEIASILINKMRNLAETYLGHRVIESVISVPVYYTRTQKDLIRQVIPHEGANYLINEPLLSIHAYGLSVPRVLVFILDNHLIQASIMEFNPAEKEYQLRGYYSVPCFEIFTSSFNMIDQEIRDNTIVERFKELITSKILRHVSLHSIDQIILLNPYLISDIELTIAQYFGKKPLSSIQDAIVIGAAKIAHEYSLQSLRDLEKKLDHQELTINSKSKAARNEF